MSDNLTQEQRDAASGIQDFLRGPGHEYVLRGYAGTGKTYTLARILSGEEKVMYVAPTHKACGVLYASLAAAGQEHAPVRTIHSLLNCKKQRMKDGTVKFMPDFTKSQAHKHNIIVCDEASMINSEMRGWLVDAAPFSKIIWMGDPCQLPPVDDESIVFRSDLPTSELTTIMRNGGVVQDAATQVRLHLGDAVTKYAQTAQDEIGRIVRTNNREFLSAYLDRRDTAKILAYTNDCVDKINAWVRREIYSDDLPDHIGERLVAVASWSDHDETLFIHSEDELVVTDMPELCHEKRGTYAFSFHKLPVKFGNQDVILEVLTKESKLPFGKYLNTLKADAIKTQYWDPFYKADERFIELRPGWATTVHKSQGSTYEEAFVVESDINKERKNHMMRNMLLYVAYSRAKRELWLA